TVARRTFSGSQREGAGTHSAFARKPAKQFAMAHAYDRGGHLCRTNRFNVYRLLQTQRNARASETVVRVISTTRGTAQPFRLKSSNVVLSVLKDRRSAPRIPTNASDIKTARVHPTRRANVYPNPDDATRH